MQVEERKKTIQSSLPRLQHPSSPLQEKSWSCPKSKRTLKQQLRNKKYNPQLVTSLIQKHFNQLKQQKHSKSSKKEYSPVHNCACTKEYLIQEYKGRDKRIKSEKGKGCNKDITIFIKNKIDQFNGLLKNVKMIKKVVDSPIKATINTNTKQPSLDGHFQNQKFMPIGKKLQAQRTKKLEESLTQRSIVYHLGYKKKSIQYAKKRKYHTLEMDQIVDPWETDPLKNHNFFQQHNEF